MLAVPEFRKLLRIRLAGQCADGIFQGALVGATLAEYLATGKGLGYLMLYDVQRFNYDQLWSAVVVLTGITVLIYYTVGAIETFALARFGPTPGRR